MDIHADKEQSANVYENIVVYLKQFLIFFLLPAIRVNIIQY